ncbi:hypothetical protein FCU94_17810 [Vibrio sp. JPW-9-11-11]|uniref:hypothetical protein n=1 Tax=Vibrio sp. JPW-9-11-11 TaxID=1416532 RepID=UPI001592D36B|nr:hypothetical protein [Vibrio sp. JPW-9-11-11]NVD08706.1 hypothetical protein [Vibrio sp. JPW-9-11-11]
MASNRWILLFVTFLTSIVWSVISFAAPSFTAPPGLSTAAAAQQKHGNSFLQTKGVVGHGLALDSHGVGVIVVFTESPGMSGIPTVVDGVKVKTVYSGRFYALAPPVCGGPPAQRPAECFSDPDPEPTVDPTARFERPVPIGVSTGHPNITAGTIGARVSDGTQVYALSNNHVFANSNQTNVPENILQPGPYDGGVENGDTYATLVDYEPILFDGSANIMDAAIALSDVASLSTATPADGYGTPSSSVETASLGLTVKKYGRTTGFTQGTVDSINATVNVCYEGGSSCTKLATFVGQVVITPGTFSAGGDSGSLIVANDSNAAVALLFAGSSSYTIGSPIEPILQRFNVTIDSGAPPPSGGDFALTASGYKVKGQHRVNLDWSGSESAQVDVYRNGVLIETMANSGFYTDNINNKGGATYNHKVCNAGSDTCSNTTVTVF